MTVVINGLINKIKCIIPEISGIVVEHFSVTIAYEVYFSSFSDQYGLTCKVKVYSFIILDGICFDSSW